MTVDAHHNVLLKDADGRLPFAGEVGLYCAVRGAPIKVDEVAIVALMVDEDAVPADLVAVDRSVGHSVAPAALHLRLGSGRNSKGESRSRGVGEHG